MRTKIIIAAVVAVCSFADVNGQSPPTDLNWSLNSSKSDEFNSTILHSKWQKMTGVKWGVSTFDPSYVLLTGSTMKLKADKINGNYFTGGIQTYDNINPADKYRYGYYEISAKFPYGKGFWPAFWVYDDSTGWYEEIDVFEPNGEQFQYCDRNVLGYHKLIQLPPPFPSGPSKVYQSSQDYLPNLSQAYHKFAVEWLPNKLVFYFDDQPTSAYCVQANMPSHHLMTLIDLQIDGNNAPNSSTLFPQYWEFDWFRHYELKRDCNTPVVISGPGSFNFSNSNSYALKKSFTFLSGFTVPSGINATLRATDFFLFNQGFTVPQNTQFTATVSPCY